MLTNINDIDLQTLSYIDDDELDNACKLNNYSKQLCQNNQLWILKIRNTFPDFPIVNNFVKAKKLYQKLRFDSLYNNLEYFILNGYLDFAKWITQKYPDEFFSFILSDNAKLKVINLEMVKWLNDEGFYEIIERLATYKAIEDGNLDIIKYLDEKEFFGVGRMVQNAIVNAKLNILQYFHNKYPKSFNNRDILDHDMLGDSVSDIRNNTQDIIDMFKWLYDKKIYLINENNDVILGIILHRAGHYVRNKFVKDQSKIRNINPKRIIAILDWFYLETNLQIDYDIMIFVIEDGVYDRKLIKNYDQTEVLQWLEDHKAADDLQ